MNDMKNELLKNAVVGQSGGPTAAINATLAGVIRGMLEEKAAGVLYGMRNGIEGFLRRDTVNLTERFTRPDGSADDAALDALAHTPAAALGSCRRKLPDPSAEENAPFFDGLFSLLREYGIGSFFYIGGNDSMDTVAKMDAYAKKINYPLSVIGVPKTIDNDLEGTDHTPGFGSAAKFVAATVREIAADCAVYTIPAITVVEIMGRDAGWLTASAALAGARDGVGADHVYLPELPFSFETFFADVRACLARHPNVVVAVSEGIRLADGQLVCSLGKSGGEKDVFGHTALAGAGKVLEGALKAELGCKVRSIELNLPQRCCSHLLSRTDIEESLAVGRRAAALALAGESGKMMTYRRLADTPYEIEISASDVHEIANCVRAVPRAYINEAGNGITAAGLAYLAPLIAGETYPVFEDGLPAIYKI